MGNTTESHLPSKVTKPGSSSTRIMRLITACLRCRLKKVKCDRKFPTCTNCSKAETSCVIKDPTTGEEVLRFTIHGLETRLQEVTDELNSLKMERLARTNTQPGPLQSGLTFGKVLLMKDTDMNSILNTDPSVMGLPPRELVETCLVSFFTASNIQVPILHRDYYFSTYFRPVYKTVGPSVWKAIFGDSFDPQHYVEEPHNLPVDTNLWGKCLFFLHIIIAILTSQRQQKYPLTISNYHKNEAFKYVDYIWRDADGGDGTELAKLEMAQSLLLLTQYSLMRPCSPGAWYLIGTCVRLCQDLGLHNESLYLRTDDVFIRDLRRRLFWSCYSLDRQISLYFGRQFGLNGRQIDGPFFSTADDLLLSPSSGEPYPISNWLTDTPKTKDTSIHFIILRIIQGDIFDYINDVGNRVTNRDAQVNDEACFEKIRCHDAWKDLKYTELLSWFKKSPLNSVASPFNDMVLKLNFNQAIIQIYGVSAITPVITNPSHHKMLYGAAQEIIWTYAELTERKLINFSWVAINNLFLGGNAYLTLISLSSSIRSDISLTKLREDCSAVMMVFEELCKICFEPANGYSKKFEAHSRSVIEQCQREREAKGAAGLSSNSMDKSASGTNVFTSMGGSTPANFVVGPPQQNTVGIEGSLLRQISSEYLDHYGILYENEELVKKTIGSIDASYGGIFEGIETEDAFLNGSY